MTTCRTGGLPAFLAASLLLMGCMSSEMRISVRPNGSGSVTHTVKVSRSAWAQFDAMAAAAGDPTAASEQRRLTITEQDARSVAWMIGKNVRMMSTQPISSGDIEGRTSVYAFDRIEDLHVDVFPPSQGMLNFHMGTDAVGLLPGRRFRSALDFELTSPERGKKLLTVRFPDQRFDPAAAPPSNEPQPKNSPEELAMLQRFVKGARVEVTIEPETKLLRTSSPHHEENRVILMALDIEKMALSDEIDRLWGFRPASFDEIRWAVHDLPGATLAIDREVTIEFEAPETSPQPAAAQMPDTEIFIAPLRVQNGKIEVGAPVNITNSPGYDNQPSFTPDGRSVLFTSARDAAPGSPSPAATSGARQTDIYRYDIAAERLIRITATPESEYSPTVMPDGKHISVVRVEGDGTQRLWRFTLDGDEPAIILRDVKPVGYHAWLDARTVALFVLGQPATLQIADTISGRTEVIWRSIGRTLSRAPDGSISFVRVELPPASRATTAAQPPVLTAMKLQRRGAAASFEVTPLVRALPGTAELHKAWMPDGTLLTTHNGILYGWRPADTDWKPLASLEAVGLSHVTRLAVSPAGDRLAVVTQKD